MRGFSPAQFRGLYIMEKPMQLRPVTTFAIALMAIGLTAVEAHAQAAPSSLTESTDNPLKGPDRATHCLAIGHAFRKYAVEMTANVTQFDAVFTEPNENEKAIKTNLVNLKDKTVNIADALEQKYSEAPTPSQAEVDLVSGMSINTLLEPANICMN